MGDMGAALRAVVAVAEPKAKVEAYRALLADVIARNDVEHAKLFVDHMLSDDVPLVVARQVLQQLAGELGGLRAEQHKAVALYALAHIQPRVVSFEEQVSGAGVRVRVIVFVSVCAHAHARACVCMGRHRGLEVRGGGAW
ncbi:unnamed protein product [Closterium sp. Yama58-4]|nr:unnamed protein product [Closterium sp. Yama58-4]